MFCVLNESCIVGIVGLKENSFKEALWQTISQGTFTSQAIFTDSVFPFVTQVNFIWGEGMEVPAKMTHVNVSWRTQTNRSVFERTAKRFFLGSGGGEIGPLPRIF